MTDSLADLTGDIIRFRDARDWAQFHTPRHLAAALAIEAAELQELTLWKSDSDIAALLADAAGRRRFEEELGDVLIYVLLLAYACEIEPLRAAQQKLALNAVKYPVDKARGKSTKYTDL